MGSLARLRVILVQTVIFLPQSELKALVFFQLLFSFFISHYIKPDFSRISPLVVMIELPAERKEDR